MRFCGISCFYAKPAIRHAAFWPYARMRLLPQGCPCMRVVLDAAWCLLALVFTDGLTLKPENRRLRGNTVFPSSALPEEMFFPSLCCSASLLDGSFLDNFSIVRKRFCVKLSVIISAVSILDANLIVLSLRAKFFPPLFDSDCVVPVFFILPVASRQAAFCRAEGYLLHGKTRSFARQKMTFCNMLDYQVVTSL